MSYTIEFKNGTFKMHKSSLPRAIAEGLDLTGTDLSGVVFVE